MKRNFLTACLGSLISVGLQSALGQVTQRPEDDFRHAAELASQGQWEQAWLLMKSAAKRASDEGDKRTAANLWVGASFHLQHLGQNEHVVDVLRQALPDSRGTDMEAVVEAFLDLALEREYFTTHGQSDQKAKQAGDEAALLNCLRMLFKVKDELPKIPAEGYRLEAQSEELNYRVDLYLEFLRRDQNSHFLGKSARDLPLSSQIFLVSAINNDSPEDLENKLNTIRDAIDNIDKNGPYQESFLRVARDLNLQEMRVDEELGAKAEAAKAPGVGKLELAKDKSQLAWIERLSGHLDQAIRLRKEALQTYKEAHSSQDALFEMANLSQLYYEKGTPDAYLEAIQNLDELVFRVEEGAAGLVGQSMDDFIGQYHEAYRMFFYATLDWYHFLRNDDAFESFVLQADRMNFRAARRDLSVYHDLGERNSIDPEIAQRFERQRGVLLRAEEDSKREAVRSAKEEFVTILEDFARKTAKFNQNFHLLSLAQVRQGMTGSDAILLYFRQEPRPEGTYFFKPPTDTFSKPLIQAAVITAQQGRLVDLNVEADSLAKLAAEARDEVVRSDAAASANLRRLAQAVWQPLGRLPEYLTIVLTPELLGLPFETLPDADGQPLVVGHNIRYAFGLAPGIGARSAPSDYQKAFVAGAEVFSHAVFPHVDLVSLPWSATEVKGIREFFNGHGVAVLPSGGSGLPETGRPMFVNGEKVDIVHLSTHSVWDGEVPLLDSLAFPRDQVYAYDLALSPMRAKLVVLSACKLFRPLDERTYGDPAISSKTLAKTVSLFPVSGVTTAALGRVAPQVVSTLWTVTASPATELFMLHFYSELLKVKDPSVALALTKRDFLSPSKLKAWMDSHGVSPPAGVQPDSHKDPYIWAPFVLVVGTP